MTREEILKRSEPVSSYDYVELPFIRRFNLDGSLCRESVEMTGETGQYNQDVLVERGVNQENAVLFRTPEMTFSIATACFTACIDLADTDVVDGCVYAVQNSGEIVIRKIYRTPDGGLNLSSLDPSDDDLHLTPELMRSQQAIVVGKVLTLGCSFY